jgi:ADP-heptose:LPS heptosyltransferase
VKKAIFLSLNALGDTLCTTPVIRAFRRANPETWIVFIAQAAPFCRVLDGNPDIDLLLYSERLYFQGFPENIPGWLAQLPIDLREPALLHRLDLKPVCTSHEAFRQPISRLFARLFDLTLESTRPIVVLNDEERRAARMFDARPYVVFSPHSVSNPVRADGNGKRKDWPIERWQELARRIEAIGGHDVFVVGSERDPILPIDKTRPLYGLPVKVVAALLERAACVVTVENGIGHLCAAVDAPTVVIYSSLMPIEWASSPESSCRRVLYGDPLDLPCDTVMDAVHVVLATRRAEEPVTA